MASSKIYNFRISPQIRDAIDAYIELRKAADARYTFSGELLKMMCEDILNQPALIETVPGPGRPAVTVKSPDVAVMAIDQPKESATKAVKKKSRKS